MRQSQPTLNNESSSNDSTEANNYDEDDDVAKDNTLKVDVQR